MIAPMLGVSLSLALAAAGLLAAPHSPASAPLRSASVAFGQTAQVVVSDLTPDAAAAAVERSYAEIRQVQEMVDPYRPSGGLARLNAAAGQGAQPIDPRLAVGLDRALRFCEWSERAFGPLGRDLNSIWGVRSGVPVGAPAPERVAQAVAVTGCERLTVDAKAGTAALQPGSALDLWGFGEGLAVDRAIESLQAAGSRNAFVRVGNVYRGFGPGPAGQGWPVRLSVSGLESGSLYLRDRALAVANSRERPLLVGSEKLAPYVNQRTGHPAEGVLATVAVTTHAMDAQPMSAIQLIVGPREGQLRLGSLKPRPSVLWIQGTGTGSPLLIEYHWSEVPKR
jgi:thiamine biosynthesis lipoprotein